MLDDVVKNTDRFTNKKDIHLKTSSIGGIMPNSKYDPSYPELVHKFSLLGAKGERLAALFEVNPSTIRDWCERYPEFAKALKKGSEIADANVANALYTRAVGYTKKLIKAGEETETHYPPDVGACIYWLKVRQRNKPDGDMWLLKDESDEPKKPLEFDDTEVARKIAFILAKAIHGETIDATLTQQTT